MPAPARSGVLMLQVANRWLGVRWQGLPSWLPPGRERLNRPQLGLRACACIIHVSVSCASEERQVAEREVYKRYIRGAEQPCGGKLGCAGQAHTGCAEQPSSRLRRCASSHGALTGCCICGKMCRMQPEPPPRGRELESDVLLACRAVACALCGVWRVVCGVWCADEAPDEALPGGPGSDRPPLVHLGRST